ncbi:MAG: DUF21 domain-containing protein [Planctomycetes bacterium]|nr:DUF21 domain-containing protein [Planctomycetota bacterium]MBI3835593.1 DUF21 domain-containing protein [Planctomycetota bacterium]
MWPIAAAIALIAVILAGFFSGSETGLYCLNRLRLHLAVQRQDIRAIRLARLLDDEPGTLTVTLVGTSVCEYIATTAVAHLLLEDIGMSEGRSEIYTVVIVMPILLVFGQIVPKNLFQMHPDLLMAQASRLLRAVDFILRATGVIAAINFLTESLSQFLGGTGATEGELAPKRQVAMLLKDALAGSQHGEHQSDLIDRVVRLSETPIRTVMIPRHRVVALTSAADRRELIRVARAAPHDTLPVFDQPSNRIVGTIRVEELLRDDDWATVAERMTPPLFIGPLEPVAVALRRMRSEKHSLAVVAPRQGVYQGIITLRDLLEVFIGQLGETLP